MKRTIVLILTVALALSMLTMPALAADNIVGTWEGTFSGTMIMDIKGTATATASDTQIMLNVTTNIPGFESLQIGGTYVLKDGKIVITAQGQSFELNYKLKGDKLTLTGKLVYGIYTVEDVKVELKRKAETGTVAIKIPETGLHLVAEDVYEAVKGEKAQFDYDISDNMSEAKLTWKSSKSKLANITGKGGLLTCKKAGDTKITLKAKQGKMVAEDSLTIRVVDLTLNKKKATIYMAGNTKKKPGQIQLTATAKPKTASVAASTVIWTSSDETTVTVKDGLVEPLQTGSATVTATNQYGQTAVCTITVK